MKAFVAVAVVLLVAGAAFLIADVAAPTLWFAVIAAGMAQAVVAGRGSRPPRR